MARPRPKFDQVPSPGVVFLCKCPTAPPNKPITADIYHCTLPLRPKPYVRRMFVRGKYGRRIPHSIVANYLLATEIKILFLELTMLCNLNFNAK